MNSNNRPVFYWSIFLGCIAILIITTACMGIAAGSSNIKQGSLQLDNGVIAVIDSNGDSVPLSGESTFELVAELESIEPWTVAGNNIETNEATQIEAGLQVGELVRVQGAILEDDKWLAYSIESAEDQTDPIIILIGVAESVDPWVVNGITLNVSEETEIQGTITPGMIVRVEILLLDDGTWDVLRIAPLGDFVENSGCATVIATVVSINGDQVQFLGWPTTVTLGDDNQTENISANQVVLAVLCASEDGQLIITQIILLNDDDIDEDTSGNKVLVCHKPDKKGGHTISIAEPAVPAHLAHGDILGACP